MRDVGHDASILPQQLGLPFELISATTESKRSECKGHVSEKTNMHNILQESVYVYTIYIYVYIHIYV